jgi:hypothetical protein
LEFFMTGPIIVFRSHVQPLFDANLDPEPAYANAAFLITLLLVSPGMHMRRRLRYLGIGLGLLFASHVCYLVAKVEYSLIQAKHPLGSSIPFIWESLDQFFEMAGKVFFPISIWLLLTLRYMLGFVDEPVKAEATAASKRVGRNDPCPCGSGKKYKHCCGRA